MRMATLRQHSRRIAKYPVRWLARPVICAALLMLPGCQQERTPGLLVGHFFLKSGAGEIRLWLLSRNRMRESVYPRLGSDQTVDGTWSLDGSHIMLSPFTDFEGNSVRGVSQLVLVAGYDSNNNLQRL